MPGDDAWTRFLRVLAEKTKSTREAPKTVRAALDNAPVRPGIFLSFGIHGNILFDDAGYCEFDDPGLAWDRIQAWAACPLPAGFEIGIASLETLAKTRPVWECLARHGVRFTNPLYSQPYLRVIGEASTLMQFREGLGILRSHGFDVPAYCSSEHALHPQLPQLLCGFGIPAAVAVVRLAGGAPSSYTPRVDWTGLDGTTIPTVTSQSGLPSGQTWHGKFFEELPSLLFAAVSRPDLTAVAFSNIEDFANPSPLAREIAAHAEELRKNGIEFLHLDELVRRLEPGKVVRWTIEDFPIKRLPSWRSIEATTRCERFLVNIEGCLAMLAASGITVDTAPLDAAWRELLLAQNHDAFVVPFTTPGLYSKMQFIEVDTPWAVKDTIETYGLRLVDHAMALARGVIETLPGQATRPVSWVQGPGASTAASLHVEDGCLVAAGLRASLSPGTSSGEPGNLSGDGWFASACPVPGGVDLSINVLDQRGTSLVIHDVDDLVITYPFGAEPSTERNGHSLHFWWINGEHVLVHDGTPYFIHDRAARAVNIDLPAGTRGFSIAAAPSLLGAYRHAWSFLHPPLHVPVPDGTSIALPVMDIAGCVPVFTRARGGEIDATFLSIDGSVPAMDGGVHVDLQGIPIEGPVARVPWRIHRLLRRNDGEHVSGSGHGVVDTSK